MPIIIYEVIELIECLSELGEYLADSVMGDRNRQVLSLELQARDFRFSLLSIFAQ